MMKRMLALALAAVLLAITGISGAEEAGTADLAYGMIIEFSFAEDDAAGDREELAGSIMDVMRKRLEGEGIDQAKLELTETDRIRAEIPDVQNPDLAGLLSAKGEILFLDPDGGVILGRDQLETAEYTYQDGRNCVSLVMTDEGRELFGKATAENVGRNIRIMLDDEVLVDATVRDPITNGRAVISGSFSNAAARRIAAQIMSGPLPAAVKVEETIMVTDAAHEAALAEARRLAEEEAKTVALKMGDLEITRGEVAEAVQDRLNMLVEMYALVGAPVDADDPEVIALAQAEAIRSLKEEMVLRAKAAELGLDRLTEEETAEAEEQAQRQWNAVVLYVCDNLLKEEGQQLEDDAREAFIQEYLDEHGVSAEEYRKKVIKEYVDGKVRDYIVRDVSVSEEEIRTEYEKRKAAGEQEENLAEDVIRARLLYEKQDAAYDAALEEWIAAAGIEEYMDQPDTQPSGLPLLDLVHMMTGH